MRPLLADLVLVTHFAVVAFVVGGLALIWAGAALGWGWVRRPAIRYAHLAAIVVVAGEALAGIMCPLTVWEDALRGGPVANAGFVARWLHRVLYWSFPDWVFTTAYVAFALAVAVTLWLVPPRR